MEKNMNMTRKLGLMKWLHNLPLVSRDEGIENAIANNSLLGII